MVRATFNIRLDDATLHDRIGQWVADGDAARAAARTIVRRLVQRHSGEPRLLDAAIVVNGPDGAPMLEMSFFEALYEPVAPVADPGRRAVAHPVIAPPHPVRRLGAALAVAARALPRPRP